MYVEFIFILTFVSGFLAMVIAACILNFQRAVGLLAFTLVAVFFIVWDWSMERYSNSMWEATQSIRDFFSKNWFGMRW